MDVDVLERDGVAHVKALIKMKEGIESEIRELQDVLQSQKVGMKDDLVDKEGFPRSDVDVHTVRIARNKIICLKNDLNSVMKEIEDGLHEVHAKARQRDNDGQENRMDTSDDKEFEAFLKVDLVSEKSPAEDAGLKLGDLVLQFGSITSTNFNGLSSIGNLVQHSKGKPLTVIVRRDGHTKNLVLTPNTWSGRGLLGCNVILVK